VSALITPSDTTGLTDEQRRIVEFGDGPLVVIAGAGTGKTKVIVDRVKCLLETREDLLPEQVLVLTYNVKAAKELQNRLEQAVGPAIRARMTVDNLHSTCHRNREASSVRVEPSIS
jgi:DNA helicase II / ATP-dependent DNA helicase PcrA